jgi:hypothetical protein
LSSGPFASGTGSTVSTTVVVPAGEAWKVIVIGFQSASSGTSAGLGSTSTLSVTGGGTTTVYSLQTDAISTGGGEGGGSTPVFGYPSASVASSYALTAGTTNTVSVAGLSGVNKSVVALVLKK